MRRLLAVALLAVCLPARSATPQATESEFIAFGDSITKGDKEFDEENKGGYPGRLENKLKQEDPSAVVHNFGRNGETTAEGLSRIDLVLGQVNGDGFLLMEGTNDINEVVAGNISFESIVSNLTTIAGRASSAGYSVYYGTLFPRHPNANLDRNNVLTFALTRAVREKAFRQTRGLVDVWETIFHTPNATKTLYDKDSQTGVGHPNSAGFTVIADTFFDVITNRDTEGPVPGELEPGYIVDSIGPGTEIELVIYDFGSGIDVENTSLAINGEPVETDQAGSMGRRTLTHVATADSLGCYAKVGIQATDLADPPNVKDRVYAEYSVDGGQIIRGDLNKSCRVDGTDLLIVALAFGARRGEPRYNGAADINNDDVINGMDLAELAANFGRSS